MLGGVAVAIVGYSLRQTEAGKYNADSPTYPIVKLHRILHKPRVDGVAARAPIEIGCAVVFRAEFVPAGADSGPTTDLYLKVFPKGSCHVAGVIVGFPVLDTAPFE